MTKIFAVWHSLTDKEKFEVTLMLFFIAVSTSILLLGIAWSRGHDVDYFKERILIMDQHMLIIDKKQHDTELKLDKVNETVTDNKRMLDAEIQRSNEQDKWIEYWKTLPSLPKPKR